MSREKPDLEALRLKIAAIEQRPALAGGAALAAQARRGEKPDPLAELLATPAGTLHEVYADNLREAGAALGFAFGLAGNLISGGRQALIYLQLTGESQELGFPYGLGLARFGLDAKNLVFARVGNLVELLWAMEEAIACRAVAAVLLDIAGQPKALDFTASRRLSLRTAAAGTSAFLLRYGVMREASAAQLRWRVRPVPSAGQRFDPLAPGAPRFAVDIEKRRLGRGTAAPRQTLVLDWTENGFAPADNSLQRPAIQLRRPAPPPRSQFAALGDRLSEAS